jgi:flagellar basal-body rod protein FlgB
LRTAVNAAETNTPNKAPAPELLYRTVVQPSADGNTVDMDVERAQFAQNAARYEASLTFLNSKIKGLLAAIKG